MITIAQFQSGFFNEKSEVWAFGVTGYEVFTDGQTPYAGIRNNDLLNQLKWGYRLPQTLSIPRRIYSIFRSCWERKQVQRFSFQEVCNAFDALIRNPLKWRKPKAKMPLPSSSNRLI